MVKDLDHVLEVGQGSWFSGEGSRGHSFGLGSSSRVWAEIMVWWGAGIMV